MDIDTRSHPYLSPVNGKPILLGFNGAHMSSDAGLTLLREIERQTGLAQRLASCMVDPRDPAKVQHSLDDIIVCAVCVPLISWIFCICYLFDKPTIEIDGEYAWQMVVMDLLDDARLSNRDVAVTDVGRMM